MLQSYILLLLCAHTYLQWRGPRGHRWCSTSHSTARHSSTCSRSTQYGRPTTVQNSCKGKITQHLKTRTNGIKAKGPTSKQVCFCDMILTNGELVIPYALQKGVLCLMASRRFFDEQNRVLPVRTSICRMTLKTSSQGSATQFKENEVAAKRITTV